MATARSDFVLLVHRALAAGESETYALDEVIADADVTRDELLAAMRESLSIMNAAPDAERLQ